MHITKVCGMPDRDSSTSRLNAQLKCFASSGNQTKLQTALMLYLIALAKILFLRSFSSQPISSMRLQKDTKRTGRATGILMIINWPAQTWYTLLVSMTIVTPTVLPRRQHLLGLPGKPDQHPLCTKSDHLAYL